MRAILKARLDLDFTAEQVNLLYHRHDVYDRGVLDLRDLVRRVAPTGAGPAPPAGPKTGREPPPVAAFHASSRRRQRCRSVFNAKDVAKHRDDVFDRYVPRLLPARVSLSRRARSAPPPRRPSRLARGRSAPRVASRRRRGVVATRSASSPVPLARASAGHAPPEAAAYPHWSLDDVVAVLREKVATHARGYAYKHARRWFADDEDVNDGHPLHEERRTVTKRGFGGVVRRHFGLLLTPAQLRDLYLRLDPSAAPASWISLFSRVAFSRSRRRLLARRVAADALAGVFLDV